MSIENTMFYVSIAAQGRNNIALQKIEMVSTTVNVS